MDDPRRSVVEFYESNADRLAQAWDEDRVGALLADVPGKRVLDVGCGHANLSAHLAGEGAEVHGIDVAGEMLRVARQRHGDLVALYRADFTAPLPFVDGCFDLAVCTLALEHTPDWDGTFRELFRVLRPGGTVVVHTNNPVHSYVVTELATAPDVTVDSADYPRVEAYGRRWGPGGEVLPLYRRPVGELLRPALDAGFVIDRFVEPGPGEFDDPHTESGPPMYVYFRLEKPPGGSSPRSG